MALFTESRTLIAMKWIYIAASNASCFLLSILETEARPFELREADAHGKQPGGKTRSSGRSNGRDCACACCNLSAHLSHSVEAQKESSRRIINRIFMRASRSGAARKLRNVEILCVIERERISYAQHLVCCVVVRACCAVAPCRAIGLIHAVRA